MSTTTDTTPEGCALYDIHDLVATCDLESAAESLSFGARKVRALLEMMDCNGAGSEQDGYLLSAVHDELERMERDSDNIARALRCIPCKGIAWKVERD